jgi:hypothetical protein
MRRGSRRALVTPSCSLLGAIAKAPDPKRREINDVVLTRAASPASPRRSGPLAAFDVLIHDYIGVDLDEVWNVASARLPELRAGLPEQFLACESKGHLGLTDEASAPRRGKVDKFLTSH